jgi:hypothetical protein
MKVDRKINCCEKDIKGYQFEFASEHFFLVNYCPPWEYYLFDITKIAFGQARKTIPLQDSFSDIFEIIKHLEKEIIKNENK